MEGILVKISCELTLSEEHLRDLGRFRQAFQQLRQAIRKDKLLLWLSSEDPQYVAFKRLSTCASSLLTSEWPDNSPSPQRATEQLLKITSNNWERDWLELR